MSRFKGMSIDGLMQEVRRINREHGWNSNVPESKPEVFSEKVLLMISELIEALEEFRNNEPIWRIYFKHVHTGAGVMDQEGNPHGYVEHHENEGQFWSDVANNKPEGIPIELADCIIRILDFAEANNINLDRALDLKLAYNETRPFRHGGKKA